MPVIMFSYYANVVWIHNAATGSRDDPYASSLHIGRDVAADVLRFAAVAVCAVIAAEAYKGRSVRAIDALKTLAPVWATLAIMALAFGAIRYGLQAIVQAGYSVTYESLPLELRVEPIIYGSLRTLTTTVEVVASFVGFAMATAVALEVESIWAAVVLGFTSTLGRGRALGTLLLSAALAILFQLLPSVAAYVPLLLHLNRVPIVDLLVWAVPDVLLWAIYALVVVVYYIDARLRLGVVVPATLIEGGEL
ncbi:MAG TPA: hypothetical protein VJN22_04005 [Candidatus Eremiobacteraceae bacterium]|nr:hypothetical protein [Candidatus Eremiobacteraceae bacterium]